MDGVNNLCGQPVILEGKAYAVLLLLGHGKGGYSYLAEHEGVRYVLKAIHHEPCSYYSFGNKIEAELRDYRTLKAAGIPVPELYAVDEKRELILKQFIDGPTVFELVEQGEDVSPLIEKVRLIAEQAKAHGINIDYFPTNFIVVDGELIYVDYECNAYMEEWDFEHWGIKYWSRTPEFLAYLEQGK